MADRTYDNEVYDNHGEIEFGGGGNAYTARTARAIVGYYKGLRICGKANHTNTGAATLNVNAYGGFPIRLPGNTALSGGEIVSGGYYDFIYDATNAVFQIQNATPVAASIPADSITNAKLADMATQTIKARKTAGTGDPEDCTLSEVLDFIGSAAQGDILYRGASAWQRLGAGTSGQFLRTAGAAANPAWAAAGTANKATPGSFTTNDGLIIQWSTTVVTLNASGNGTVTFASAFPNAFLGGVVCNGDPAASGNLVFSINHTSSTTSALAFGVRANPGAINVRVNWIAIGH